MNYSTLPLVLMLLSTIIILVFKKSNHEKDVIPVSEREKEFMRGINKTPKSESLPSGEQKEPLLVRWGILHSNKKN